MIGILKKKNSLNIFKSFIWLKKNELWNPLDRNMIVLIGGNLGDILYRGGGRLNPSPPGPYGTEKMLVLRG